MIWVEFCLIGALAGFLAGYLGIGGGLVIVPALTWIFTREPVTANLAAHYAVATSLGTMLFTSLSSVIAHHRRGAIDWPLVRRLATGLALGAPGPPAGWRPASWPRCSACSPSRWAAICCWAGIIGGNALTPDRPHCS